MQTHDLPQGSAQWHAHRNACWNASDAPAALGCSPYTTRAQLLQRVHTGLQPEVDAATQRVFDNGHRFEALARPLAEEIIGDDLAPLVGSIEVPGLSRPLSASFDGLNFTCDTAFEHKTLNAELRACMQEQGNGYSLPKHYRVQMEQQLLVSGADRVLFMASEWTGDGTLVEERHCWYASDPQLRAEILAAWKQFEADLADYTPPAAAPQKIVAEPVEALPAVSVVVEGALIVRENFSDFQQRLMHFLHHRLIREPKTDRDFVNLDAQIKEMKAAEEALQRAEAQMLAQIQSVDQAKKTKDMLAKLVRENRLMAEKLLTNEKERRRSEIVAGGISALQQHVAALNRRLGANYLQNVAADFAGAIRGKKSLTSMEDAVATELARAKISTNETADRVQDNLAWLQTGAKDHLMVLGVLFADLQQIALKGQDDFRAVATNRIAAYEAEQRAKEEAQRARIRAEEQARAQREAQEVAAREQRQRDEAAALERRQREEAEAEQRRQEQEAAAREQRQREEAAQLRANADNADAADGEDPLAGLPLASANVVPMPTKAPAGQPTLRLGEIKRRIAPLQIDAAGLDQLGFKPAGRDGAAKLYHEADFARICAALVSHLTACAQQQRAA